MSSPHSSLPEPSEEGYLASLSDLMVGLLFIFIIILMAFALNYREAETVTAIETAKTREETARLKQQAVVLQEQTIQQQQAQQHLVAATQRQRAVTQRLMQETETLMQQTVAQKQETEKLQAEKQRLEQVLQRLTNNNTVRRNLLHDIQNDLAMRGVQVYIDEKNGILRLPEALLFDSGQAVFRPDGEKAIEQLANVLADILPCYSATLADFIPYCQSTTQARLDAVFIEGHTDDQAIRTSEFANNWALAMARALNTYQALTQHESLLDSLQNAQYQALLSVSAYEARRPVVKGKSSEARRQNRRIDLRFIMASPPPEIVQRAREELERN